MRQTNMTQGFNVMPMSKCLPSQSSCLLSPRYDTWQLIMLCLRPIHLTIFKSLWLHCNYICKTYCQKLLMYTHVPTAQSVVTSYSVLHDVSSGNCLCLVEYYTQHLVCELYCCISDAPCWKKTWPCK